MNNSCQKILLSTRDTLFEESLEAHLKLGMNELVLDIDSTEIDDAVFSDSFKMTAVSSRGDRDEHTSTFWLLLGNRGACFNPTNFPMH